MGLPLLIRDARFRDHAPRGEHPECPERLAAVDAALEPLANRMSALPLREAEDHEILRAHTRSHLDGLRALAGSGKLDPDTYFGPSSFGVARLAAGSLIDAALAVARGDAPSAFAAVRPPGHHAERDRAMGFCLLNSVALAAEALRAEAGLERIAILDWDVHHGNGTQHHFEAERDVLFVSTHQFPFYPGTGAADERGEGAGEGATLNLPLPAGCGDREYEAVFERIVVPALAEFRPELILVSAGFDAHERDPLASMRVTSAGFGRLAQRIRLLADAVCGGRLVLALEGGYDLAALAETVSASAAALLGDAPEASPQPPASEAEFPLVARLREYHSGSWRSLR